MLTLHPKEHYKTPARLRGCPFNNYVADDSFCDSSVAMLWGTVMKDPILTHFPLLFLLHSVLQAFLESIQAVLCWRHCYSVIQCSWKKLRLLRCKANVERQSSFHSHTALTDYQRLPSSWMWMCFDCVGNNRYKENWWRHCWPSTGNKHCIKLCPVWKYLRSICGGSGEKKHSWFQSCLLNLKNRQSCTKLEQFLISRKIIHQKISGLFFWSKKQIMRLLSVLRTNLKIDQHTMKLCFASVSLLSIPRMLALNQHDNLNW